MVEINGIEIAFFYFVSYLLKLVSTNRNDYVIILSCYYQKLLKFLILIK